MQALAQQMGASHIEMEGAQTIRVKQNSGKSDGVLAEARYVMRADGGRATAIRTVQ